MHYYSTWSQSAKASPVLLHRALFTVYSNCFNTERVANQTAPNLTLHKAILDIRLTGKKVSSVITDSVKVRKKNTWTLIHSSNTDTHTYILSHLLCNMWHHTSPITWWLTCCVSTHRDTRKPLGWDSYTPHWTNQLYLVWQRQSKQDDLTGTLYTCVLYKLF